MRTQPDLPSETFSASSDEHSLLDLVRLRVAQIQRCEIGVAHYSSKFHGDEKSLQQLENLESWPIASSFDDRECVALALAELLSRPTTAESSVLPHLFRQAQQYLTRSEIIKIVVAVEAMQEWKESEVYVPTRRARGS